MFKIFKKEMEWGGRPLTIETGKMARQADGAVMVTYGGTQVLAAVTFAKSMKEGQDFFPLTVNYIDRPSNPPIVPRRIQKRNTRCVDCFGI